MKNKILVNILSSLFVIGFIIGCNEYKEPQLINDPSQTYSGNPSISSITPSGSAIAGVREITISGQNFAVGKDTNWVYIGGKPAIIKSVSATSIVVYRPPIFGNSLAIDVVVPKALATAQVKNYSIDQAVFQFGDFSRYNYPITAMEVDKNENIYLATRRLIMKESPNGIDILNWANLSSTFAGITDLKFGPTGLLYVAIDDYDVYSIDPSSASPSPTRYVSLPVITDKIDFDSNKNMYAALSDGIYVVNYPSKAITFSGKYQDTTLVEIRVLNNSLYAASSTNLWSNQILDAKGKLSKRTQILDVTAMKEFSNCQISSFNMTSTGILLVSLKNHPKYSIFVLGSDGSLAPYYMANILPNSVDQMVYGSGKNLYFHRGSLARDSVRVYKMGMEAVGAPYLGR